MKKALIFGITGQDGSYLAELLLEEGYEVTGVTRRVSVNTTERISHILPRLTIVEGDITDAFNVMRIIEDCKPDEIYNLAAQSHVGTSFSQPSLTWDVTAGGVLNILEAIRHSERCFDIRFYQASTSELFGKNYDESENGEKFQNEQTQFLPQSPYAAAKLAAHNLVRIYRDGYGMHCSSGILFNHESERRGEQFVTRKITKWIGEFVAWVDKTSKKFKPGEPVGFAASLDDDYIRCTQDTSMKFPKLRLGNLQASRDWGHAEDYVRAMWLMLQQDSPDDYVIATGEAHTIAGFLDVAFTAIGSPHWENFVVVDPKFYRPAEVDYLCGCPKKAKELLGWDLKISFDDLVLRMVESDVKAQGLQRPNLQTVSADGPEEGQAHMSNVQEEGQKSMA